MQNILPLDFINALLMLISGFMLLIGFFQLNTLGPIQVASAHGNENYCTNGSQLRGRPSGGKNVVVLYCIGSLSLSNNTQYNIKGRHFSI